MIENNPTQLAGLDVGMGAIKMYSPVGGILIPSQVSLNGNQQVGRMVGLRNQKPPMLITTENGQFYVGPGAHDWGRPVENLDYDRLSGSPEMLALFLAALMHLLKDPGVESSKGLILYVGLPHELLSGEQAKEIQALIRRWMMGVHQWEVNRQLYGIEIIEVKFTSQAAAAVFDHSLNEQGQFLPHGRAILKNESGVISIGFNTVELLVIRDKKPVQRFTTGVTAGVRRLLEIVNSQQMYSLGELDTLLRAGRLDIKDALPVWEREVTGVIERYWGQSWKRFSSILLVGGGAALLKESLLHRFVGKATIPDDPVISIARGLYKLGLYQERRKRE